MDHNEEINNNSAKKMTPILNTSTPPKIKLKMVLHGINSTLQKSDSDKEDKLFIEDTKKSIPQTLIRRKVLDDSDSDTQNIPTTVEDNKEDNGVKILEDFFGTSSKEEPCEKIPLFNHVECEDDTNSKNINDKAQDTEEINCSEEYSCDNKESSTSYADDNDDDDIYGSDSFDMSVNDDDFVVDDDEYNKRKEINNIKKINKSKKNIIKKPKKQHTLAKKSIINKKPKQYPTQIIQKNSFTSRHEHLTPSLWNKQPTLTEPLSTWEPILPRRGKFTNSHTKKQYGK